jgi:hypothetical protein
VTTAPLLSSARRHPPLAFAASGSTADPSSFTAGLRLRRPGAAGSAVVEDVEDARGFVGVLLTVTGSELRDPSSFRFTRRYRTSDPGYRRRAASAN